MEVLEFRKITTNDCYDEYYNDGFSWSRVYEYPLVIREIRKYYKDGFMIHNSSWGFEGIHIKFKEKLDDLFNKVKHSDILPSELPNTFVYDITKSPDNEEIKKYDIVINVSTLEEVKSDHLDVFNNLFQQVKKGGLFIATFDLNKNHENFFKLIFSKKKRTLQLNKFEKLFSKNLDQKGESINGCNSELRNMKYKNLNCGIMVIRK